MVGLDGTGKKTILDRLQPNPIPSIKRHLVVLEYKNISFNVYNVGTGGKNQLLGPLWKHLYPTTQGIIYVVDSSDRDAIEKRAKKGLHAILAEQELRNAVILVLANKQDLPNAMSLNEVTEHLGLDKIPNREWYIQGTCARKANTIYGGLDWLTNTLLE